MPDGHDRLLRQFQAITEVHRMCPSRGSNYADSSCVARIVVQLYQNKLLIGQSGKGEPAALAENYDRQNGAH